MERKKKELESQRDELKETLRNERVKFEKDGKLLKFACEDATKELEIVKQSYREEKEHDEQVIQSLRDALDAVVSENRQSKDRSTFSPPATPRSKPPSTPKSPLGYFAIVSNGKRPVGVGSGDAKGLAKKAKEKAERAIATARVAMEAAATRAKTDGAKIEELEKQLMEARRTSNEETTTTRDDYEKENDNDDNVTADKDANVDELKVRIEKLESHCVDASAAAKNAADALDTANEELRLDARSVRRLNAKC